MMKKFIANALLAVAVASSLLSCNEDIKPKRPIVDQPGVVFIEDGRRDTVPTSFSSEQLKKALVDMNWEFSYSFFYDDYKIGSKGQDVYFSRFRYDYRDDGTAVATDLVDGKTYDYNYSVNARIVTLKGATGKSFSFGVIAMDSYHMICDESLVGESAPDFDSNSLTRRMVFLSRKK